MEIKDRIADYKKQTEQLPTEMDILETVRKSKEIFYEKEQERLLTYGEFLRIQFQLIRKRWWLLQMFFLAAAGYVMSSIQEEYFIHRTMGIAGVLFVVLAIPELWKNRSCCSMEIEACTYYSLRQIYAARIFLFGLADLCLLTVFCTVLLGGFQIAAYVLVSQFLFPMVVAACICFGMLCSRHDISESVSMVFCFMWCALWWLVTINERIYSVILLPVWLVLLGLASLFLAAAVYKTLQDCSQNWEVRFDGIRYH